MKELGWIEVYFSTDNENWTHINYSDKLHYAQSFNNVITEFRYEDVESKYIFDLHKPKLFNKKEYKYKWCGLYNEFRIYPNQKLYVKKVWVTSDSSNWSFDRLSRELNAEEFIEYLKDRGLNVCPINK